MHQLTMQTPPGSLMLHRRPSVAGSWHAFPSLAPSRAPYPHPALTILTWPCVYGCLCICFGKHILWLRGKMHCQHSLLECGCANMPTLHNIIHGLLVVGSSAIMWFMGKGWLVSVERSSVAAFIVCVWNMVWKFLQNNSYNKADLTVCLPVHFLTGIGINVSLYLSLPSVHANNRGVFLMNRRYVAVRYVGPSCCSVNGAVGRTSA